MIERHWDGGAVYRQPENKMALGFVEGLNNKIRVYQRRALWLARRGLLAAQTPHEEPDLLGVGIRLYRRLHRRRRAVANGFPNGRQVLLDESFLLQEPLRGVLVDRGAFSQDRLGARKGLRDKVANCLIDPGTGFLAALRLLGPQASRIEIQRLL